MGIVTFLASLYQYKKLREKYGQIEILGGVTSRDEFIRSLELGIIKPASVRQTADNEGPLMIFDFPDLKCHIHTHFNDDGYEDVGRSHIKPYDYDGKDYKIAYIDNYTLAMLRHYVEVD